MRRLILEGLVGLVMHLVACWSWMWLMVRSLRRIVSLGNMTTSVVLLAKSLVPILVPKLLLLLNLCALRLTVVPGGSRVPFTLAILQWAL